MQRLTIRRIQKFSVNHQQPCLAKLLTINHLNFRIEQHQQIVVPQSMNESFCSETLLPALLFKVYRRLRYQDDFYPCKKRLTFMGLVNTTYLLVGLPRTRKKPVTTEKLRNAPFIPATSIINTKAHLVSTPKQCDRNNEIFRLSENNRVLLCNFAKFNTRQND